MHHGFIFAFSLASVLGCARHAPDKPIVESQESTDVVGYLSDVAKGYVVWFTPRGSKPRLSPVYGKVTRNGRPLSSGHITLIPTDTSRGTASGIIDANGTYALYSGASGLRGVEPGKYTVRLAKDSSKSDEPFSDGLGGLVFSSSKPFAIIAGPQRLDITLP